jgi:sialate O-acetylesterase
MKYQRTFLVLILFLTVLTGWGKIRLPSILASGMVLQQQSTVNIWGWASPGEKITVNASWLVEEALVIAGPSGKWLTRLPTGTAGGPHTITIKGENTIILSDVLFGEVWVCSGQSNMEFSVKMLGGWKLYPAEKKNLKKHDYSQVRLCQVKHIAALTPEDSCETVWLHADLKSVSDFSATGWFFGQCLHDWLGVPVGLISSNIGGTPAEAWTERSFLAGDPDLRYYLASPNSGPTQKVCRATVLYNAMINPLVNFRIKGAIWYQGESNINDADLYGKLFPAMIRSWRTVWNQGDFPFYFVQIAPYDYGEPFPAAAYLREAQTMALALPNTGMAVTMDIGNVRDIHPKNKPAVGQRLALLALANTYGKEHVYSTGPVINRIQKEGSRFRLYFDNADTLISQGGKPVCFTISGHDGRFRAANAIVEGKTVAVSCDSIPDPVNVRYAFADADSVNLFNRAGLPAAPFRSDSIPLLVRNVTAELFIDSLDHQRYLKLSCLDSSCQVHFTLDGSEPTVKSPVFQKMLMINKSVQIRACAYKGELASALAGKTTFLKHLGVDKRLAVTFQNSPKYTGRENALLDGLMGSEKYYDGQWQGYEATDFEGVIDLGKPCRVDTISLSVLQDVKSWIFLPVKVEISTSADGLFYSKVADFTPVGEKTLREPSVEAFTWKRKETGNEAIIGSETAEVNGQPSSKVRYIKVYAKNTGKCPKWHPGSGDKAWLFIDEISVW